MIMLLLVISVCDASSRINGEWDRCVWPGRSSGYMSPVIAIGVSIHVLVVSYYAVRRHMLVIVACVSLDSIL